MKITQIESDHNIITVNVSNIKTVCNNYYRYRYIFIFRTKICKLYKSLKEDMASFDSAERLPYIRPRPKLDGHS